jgi:hypothetical protein
MEEADREFLDDQASKVIMNAIEKVFGGMVHIEKDQLLIVYKAAGEKERQEVHETRYDKEKANFYTSQLMDECIKGLAALGKP